MVINKKRLKIILKGLLQGIGFRPLVYRLATLHGLTGWVANDTDSVVIEVEGEDKLIQLFFSSLQSKIPACGYITESIQLEIALQDDSCFQLMPSLSSSHYDSIHACPDIAVCADCISELFDSANRRFLHPFISCCHCGPRYSIIKALPYDRPFTTLSDFPLCENCLQEYQNPSDRRFHAQTLSCPDCGPQLTLYDSYGKTLLTRQTALSVAITELQTGKIIAIKGIGGFQLLVDAGNQTAVSRLRKLKQRLSKPFALMVASLAQAETLCELNDIEWQSLLGAAAPIVLAKERTNKLIVEAVAPEQSLLGIMLPYSPLHHLIMAAIKTPVVATSGNSSGGSICIDNQQAVQKLAGIADFFLVHDRTILRPLDDSIVRVIAGTPTVLRRARGFVPTPIRLNNPVEPSLSVGGQLKNTVAVASHSEIVLSQHLGDLEQLSTAEQQCASITDLCEFYAIEPQHVFCDLHSDYVSTRTAHRFKANDVHPGLQTVQHHYAHILSCMAEHQLEPPLLGIAWDGTGLGTDNTLWGGEFLQIEHHGFKRVAHCRPFPLVGAYKAIKEPRRAALGLLYAWLGEDLFKPEYAQLLKNFSYREIKLLHGLLKKQLNSPQTTSIGRLFDAFASLLDLCQINEFEGQAAMALEACAMNESVNDVYSMAIIEEECLIIDWQPMLENVLADLGKLPKSQIAARIHHSFASWVFAIAEKTSASRLVLSGGCFQNAYLVEAIVNSKSANQYSLFRHAQIPPNDGGLALGQIYASQYMEKSNYLATDYHRCTLINKHKELSH